MNKYVLVVPTDGKGCCNRCARASEGRCSMIECGDGYFELNPAYKFPSQRVRELLDKKVHSLTGLDNYIRALANELEQEEKGE